VRCRHALSAGGSAPLKLLVARRTGLNRMGHGRLRRVTAEFRGDEAVVLQALDRIIAAEESNVVNLSR
jgi:hypothetical protein